MSLSATVDFDVAVDAAVEVVAEDAALDVVAVDAAVDEPPQPARSVPAIAVHSNALITFFPFILTSFDLKMKLLCTSLLS